MLDKLRQPYAWPALLIALVGGAVLYHVFLSVAGYVVAPKSDLDDQQQEVAQLEAENDELWEDLLSLSSSLNEDYLPYDETADARADVLSARTIARSDHEYLMVTFGANWCLDCRTLYKHLQSPDVVAYTQGLFSFVHVNVGKFNRNNDLAAELGATLEKGIPVAIFFDRDGQVIGTTNEGQLEPARRYSSKQILAFLKGVAERSLILDPGDSD